MRADGMYGASMQRSRQSASGSALATASCLSRSRAFDDGVVGGDEGELALWPLVASPVQ
jgi:hypothetical protein